MNCGLGWHWHFLRFSHFLDGKNYKTVSGSISLGYGLWFDVSSAVITKHFRKELSHSLSLSFRDDGLGESELKLAALCVCVCTTLSACVCVHVFVCMLGVQLYQLCTHKANDCHLAVGQVFLFLFFNAAQAFLQLRCMFLL